MNKRILAILLLCLLATHTASLNTQASQFPGQSIAALEGFPRTEPYSIDFAAPIVVDINADGGLDVLVADNGGCIWAWDQKGAALPNFPIAPFINCQSSNRINSLAVANLDSDPHLEIIVGTAGPGYWQGSLGKVYVYDSSGALQPGWPQEMQWNRQFGADQAEVYSVVAANVTGDSRLEVLAGTSNNSSAGGPIDSPTPNLFVWSGDGVLQEGFPTWHRRAGIFGLIGAGNLDQDGCMEIVVPRGHRWLHAYDSYGQYLPGWPVESFVDAGQGIPAPYLEFTRNAPAMADLNGDQTVEIVISGLVKLSETLTQGEIVFTNSGVMVLEASGERMPGWQTSRLGDGPPLSASFGPSQAPALADLDRDGLMEIVITLADGTIRAYRYDGHMMWRYDFADGKKLFASEPVIGDVSGDGQLDVVFGTYSPEQADQKAVSLIALDLHGQILPGFPLALDHEDSGKKGIRAAPTLADLDGDGDVEIIAASWSGSLYIWDLPAPYRAALMPWPTARHDIHRTGFYARPSAQGGYPAKGMRFELPFFIPPSDPILAPKAICP